MWSISCRHDYNFLNYLTYCAVSFSINLQFYYHDGVFPFLTWLFHEDFFRPTDHFARTDCPFSFRFCNQ
ncbi:hypothetical protein FEK42_08945 [Escherichia sp. E2748]|nr:hypothetical protein FEK42_08945 [Escherichia sp. E2748]